MRHFSSFLIAPLLLVGLVGCTASSDRATPSPSAPSSTTADAHWSYEGADGPTRWGQLSDAYRECSVGEQQSPVDLPATAPAGGIDLTIDHGDLDETTADNGHTVQMTFGAGGSVVADGTSYALQQVHHHAGSEHTVAGEDHPVEFHFVHRSDAGELLVIGVFGTEGAHNDAYGSLVAQRAGTVDVGRMLPADTAHWTYEGSLTTPPCTEGVRWVVLTAPVELSEDQIEALEDAHDDNHRPVQPLNGRTIG